MVVISSIGFEPEGDCVNGSGEVPQEELAPTFELDEADGELVAPRPYCAESRLYLESFVMVLAMDGVKTLENLVADRSWGDALD
jgi:hypothetical protein